MELAATVRCPPAVLRSLRQVALRFLAELDEGSSQLSVSLVSDRRIRALNRRWRGKDRPTDVLSFEMGDLHLPAVGSRILGDVVISWDTARRTARVERRGVEDQLALNLAHGLLHLLGHDHHAPAEARRMAKAERALLGSAGLVALALDTSPRPRRTSVIDGARRSRS